jgi:START domain
MGLLLSKCKDCLNIPQKNILGLELDVLDKSESHNCFIKETKLDESVLDSSHELIYQQDSFQPYSDQFFLLLSEKTKIFYHEIHRKDTFVVYAKDVGEGFSLKLKFCIPCKPIQFVKFIQDVPNRKLWDKYIDTITEIPSADPETTITYYKFKKMLSISQREMTLVSKLYKLSDKLLLLSTSYKTPETNSVQNLAVSIAGYYLTGRFDDQGKEYTKGICIIKGNLGGGFPQHLMKKATASGLCKFHESIEEGITKYYN